MQLSAKNIKGIKQVEGLVLPGDNLFQLPEKVLQFGTGVLLRGLPDYFIDKANRQGVFNGRIVVVKSTSQGSTDEFAQQDGLYTLYVRGIENGEMKEEAIVNSSISRVLSAKDQWSEILKCAHNPEIQVVISNTTEVGIVLTDDRVDASPPQSFPGKLLAFLFERYKAFEGKDDKGMVIVPTELIIDNGSKLRSIVLELAANNTMDGKFIEWLKNSNHFCNSLVDRIVPGKMPDAERKAAEEKLGYTDELMIMAETFRLWAIESSSDHVRSALSFSQVDEGVVLTPDIEKFRELKLRLLNGTHTFSSGMAYLAGFETVKEFMRDKEMSAFLEKLMLEEIAVALDGESISYSEASVFASQVMDRFKNPFLDHKWISITMNFSSKMKLRNVPLLLKYYQKKNQVPQGMALGFAAYLLFMKGTSTADGNYKGESNGSTYNIQDDMAGYFAEKWSETDAVAFTGRILSDIKLWDTDLTKLPGFAEAVAKNLKSLQQYGVKGTLAGKQLKTVA
jgi:tagaturonate reductase